mmetsp:Transcript_18724/g.24115  ORF Transcript_18724/g.24115 Transcript_18724/m.24115 type:complete len:144 (+) Transcript_18724:984-1415(+)
MRCFIAVSLSILEDCSSIFRSQIDSSQQQQQQQQHPILNMTMTMTQEDEQQSLEYHLLQKLEYLSSGLWRSVWAVNPGIAQELAVFKFMKQKRDVDHRNMERHRRDALVMERFTSSPNVVDIFAHCGKIISLGIHSYHSPTNY